MPPVVATLRPATAAEGTPAKAPAAGRDRFFGTDTSLEEAAGAAAAGEAAAATEADEAAAGRAAAMATGT